MSNTKSWSSYKAVIELPNLRSSVQLWLQSGEFKGFYICLAGVKAAWKEGIQPLVCVDGTWLKGTFKGELLSAVSMDPNDQIFPISWAVIVKENRERLTWFLSLLGDDLEIVNDHHVAFMSDRQKVNISLQKYICIFYFLMMIQLRYFQSH